jgi:glyceraldehyde 3-phosphate dehydrogenase
VNSILEAAAKEDRWQGIFSTTRDPIVSTDIIGSRFASIADLSLTRVVGGNLVKVLGWYDNEMGYAHTLLRHVKEAGKIAHQ